MPDKNDKTTVPFWKKLAQSPSVEGPLMGATVMAMVTPLLNWTNHVMNDKPMVWRNAWSGGWIYASSAVPSYAVVFTIKGILQPASSKPTPLSEFTTSLLAGGLSGLASTPFDAVAQNKQLTGCESSQETRKKMIASNGYRSLLKGGAATMAREGIWSTVYLTAVPALSQYLISNGMDKNKAQATSLILTAGTYGLFSTPLNQLRSRKQKGLTEPLQNKSYLQHAQDIWNQVPAASRSQRLGFFFKGAIPRTITTTVAGGLLVKGQELYHSVVGTPKG